MQSDSNLRANSQGSVSDPKRLRLDSTCNRSEEFQDFSSIIRRSHSIDESKFYKMNLSPAKSKCINDSVHGYLNFPSVVMAVIDTPQFQRLRFLKQTGTIHFVFPNATHTRFQHSLGVAFLAQKFATELRKKHPDLLDEKDIICVMLAGLCHDLGHGPYSHLWENFIRESGKTWHHETSSIEVLDNLICENNLRPILLAEGGIVEIDILFIKELIAGPINEETGLPSRQKIDIRNGPWPYKGRPESKSFLYEIVANKTSGIDVDKWDYFIRDDYYLKIGHVFNYERFINYCLVKEVPCGDSTRRKICLRDKEAELVQEMFRDRARLHHHGYQHRVGKIIDRMMVDAFMIADKKIRITGANKKSYSLSDSWQDVTAHIKLTDELVFYKILESEDPELEGARVLLRRILKREFYRSVSEINVPKKSQLRQMSVSEIETHVRRFVGLTPISFEVGDPEEVQKPLQPDEVIVLRRRIDFGMGQENPVKHVTFYSNCCNGSGSYISTNVTHNLGDHIDADVTLWVCCTRAESRSVRETLQAVRDWAMDMDIKDLVHVKMSENGNGEI